ncbi:MAG: hypothetical protein H0X17_01695 [Deltaproteobacteria bacterium]|nr:hypothetical protein [Deltaproteobacteria bacterium]
MLRPGVRRQIERDKAILLGAARLLSLRPTWRLNDPVGHTEHFVEAIYEQTDLRLEARNYTRFRRNFAGRTDVSFPEIHEQLSTERLLTMAFVRGTKVDALLTSMPPERRRALAAPSPRPRRDRPDVHVQDVLRGRLRARRHEPRHYGRAGRRHAGPLRRRARQAAPRGRPHPVHRHGEVPRDGNAGRPGRAPPPLPRVHRRDRLGGAAGRGQRVRVQVPRRRMSRSSSTAS